MSINKKIFFALFMLLRFCYKHHLFGETKTITMYDMVGLPWFVALIECDDQIAVVCRLNRV